MKTIKIILSALCMIICAEYAVGQDLYPISSGTIKRDGYTYKYDKPYERSITLYNIDNKLTYTQMLYKDGSNLAAYPKRSYNNMKEIISKMDMIINSAFTNEQKTKMNHLRLNVYVIGNPDTGEVWEVNFNFQPTSVFRHVPIEVYRKIELEIKKNIEFEVSEEGYKRNYILLVGIDEMMNVLRQDFRPA